MAGQLRAIRQRIRGVQSIAKITRAQELIAASRIIKAHPRVREPENSQRAAVLILSSDRGFAGGYNTNVMREAQALRARLRERDVEPVTYVSGTKAITWHRFRGVETAGSWHGFSETPRQENAREITEALFEAFNLPADDGGVGES